LNVPGPLLKIAGRLPSHFPSPGVPVHAIRIHEDEPKLQLSGRWLRNRNMFGIYEGSRSAGVLEKLADLICVKRSVERHRGAARGDDSEVCRDPARVVVRQDGQSRSARKALFGDPPAHRLCHAVKFGVGAAFTVVVGLKFQRHIVRPALGTFDKAIVESRHASWGIYTKIASGRSAWDLHPGQKNVKTETSRSRR
jgi:hypothetical protein